MVSAMPAKNAPSSSAQEDGVLRDEARVQSVKYSTAAQSALFSANTSAPTEYSQVNDDKAKRKDARYDARGFRRSDM